MPSITTWTRLEPCSRHANIQKGLQACVHDPLWLLARQWQLGEFQAEDAGTPVSARLRGQTRHLNRFYAGAIPNQGGTVPAQSYHSNLPLEMVVEKESLTDQLHPGRMVEASLYFFRQLKAKLKLTLGENYIPTLRNYRQAFLNQYPYVDQSADYSDAGSDRFLRLVSDRTFNTTSFYDDLKQNPNMVNWVSFTDVAGLVFEDNVIRKTAANGWGTGGAVSVHALTPGEDGWVAATCPSLDSTVFFGLSEASPDHRYESIDYAVYFYKTSIYVYEKGEVKRQVRAGGFAPDDLMRIERQGSTVRYFINGELIYTSETPSTSQLLIDLAFNFQGTELSNFRSSQAGHIPPALEEAIAPEHQDVVRTAIRDWLQWYNKRYGDPTPNGDAWLPERMEHSFAVAATSQDTTEVYVANEYHGGHLDWYHLNQSQNLTLQLDSAVVPPSPYVRTVIPSPVSFRGMPDARWWTFEDANLNLGNIDAGKEDLGRMLLLQYALNYSDDWFLIPLELNVGASLTIQSLVVTDTFGVRTLVKPFGEVDGADGTWQMFTYGTDSNEIAPSNHLFLPPTLPASLSGHPVEEIHLLRDEMANLAWAVEVKVENAWGKASIRHETVVANPFELLPETTNLSTEIELVYRLMNDVPPHWIPLVPIPEQPVEPPQEPIIKLQRGRMLTFQNQGQVEIPAMGQLLTPDQPLKIENEEVERVGAHVTRAYQYTRWFDGTTHLWMGRQKRIGRGEGWSGLRFDIAEPVPESNAE